MVYECEHCEAVLGPGLMACPRCGQAFDEPVPEDAILADEEGALLASLPQADLPPARPRCPVRFFRLASGALGILVLTGLGWLGVRVFAPLRPPVPATVVRAPPAPLTESRAHPAYAADMTAFVRTLRASGVGAQWPAFGGSDTLLITPPTGVGGQRAGWNADLYKQLAQGIYASFWEKRYETGFSDSDSTTCFVLVCDQSGKVVAVDLMGNVE